jgi:hypothetical protein
LPTCTRCNKSKRITAFYIHHRTICKHCINEYNNKYSNSSWILKIPVPKAGLYQLDITRSVPGLQRQQFGQLTISVPDGNIVKAGKIKIYDEELRSNSKDKNGLSAIPSEASAGSTVTIRLQYDKTVSENIRNVTLLLEVPEKTALINRSITLKNVPVIAKPIGSYYALPLGNLQQNLSGLSHVS